MPKTLTREKFLSDKSIKLEQQYRNSYFDLINTNFAPDIMSNFLKEIDPLLKKISNAYLGTQFPPPTLAGRLKVLAIRAIKNYDPTKAALNTYLYTNLRNIMEETRKEVSPAYVSSKVGLTYQKIITAKDELTTQLGREPSVAELADHLGLSQRKIQQVLSRLPPILSESLQAVDSEGEMTSLTAMATHTSPEREKKKLMSIIEAVYVNSSPVEQKIIEHTYGLYDSPILSVNEIAKKVKLSPGRVSQLKKKIFQNISEYLGVVHGANL
jgi:RNA polymerase sigma factor (sigma-70 family)